MVQSFSITGFMFSNRFFFNFKHKALCFWAVSCSKHLNKGTKTYLFAYFASWTESFKSIFKNNLQSLKLLQESTDFIFMIQKMKPYKSRPFINRSIVFHSYWHIWHIINKETAQKMASIFNHYNLIYFASR